MNNQHTLGLMDLTQSIVAGVDVQQRLSPAMDPQLWQRNLPRAAFTLQCAGMLDVPVILTEQYPQGLGETLPQIAQAAGPAYQERIIKSEFSCWRNPDFVDRFTALAHARQMTSPTLVLLGIETHVCILQTAFDVLEAGYRVVIVEDGVCSRYQGNHANALDRMVKAGMTVINSESLVFEWMRDSKHPAFRDVSKALKALG